MPNGFVRLMSVWWMMGALICATGCSRTTPDPAASTAPAARAAENPEAAPELAPPKPTPPASAKAAAKTKAKAKPEILPLTAEDGKVGPVIAAAMAEREDRDLVVYVGAEWCEPCKRFKNALKSGLLNRQFGQLTLLEFDLDKDRIALKEAGYDSRMIPLFEIPKSDGIGSGKRISGSVKGPQAIGNITPRLQALLAEAGGTPTGAVPQPPARREPEGER